MGRPQGIWRSFDGTDGLPAGVWSILHDGAGQLWLGTRAGLVRFDGSRFTAYTRADGLAGDEVLAVCPGEGGLWIGTTTGLSFFDGEQFARYGLDDGLPSEEIEDLCAGPDGTVWIATRAGAVCWREGRFERLESPGGLPCNDIRRIQLGPDGSLWLATVAGLVHLDGERLRCYTRSEGLLANHVLSVSHDRQGRVWVGTLVGLTCHDPETFEVLEQRVPLGMVNVRAVHEDSTGRVWIGSIGEGLYCLADGELLHYGIRDGLLGEHVTAIVEDAEGHIWAGDGLSGLNCFLGQTVEALTDVPVTEDLRRDRHGRLWFASGNNLGCLEAGRVSRSAFDVRVFGLLFDRDERLWVATWGEGLYCFETAADLWSGRGRVYTTSDGLGSNNIAGLMLDSEGRVWAGCGYPGQLCRFQSGRFEAIPTPLRVVFRMLESRQGGIWMAGFSSNGLARYRDGRVEAWSDADGLPSEAVQSLVEDATGALWVGTRQGLARFDGQRFAGFDRQAGLLTLDNQVAACDPTGQLWFGTKCGIYRLAEGHLQMLTHQDGLPGNAITALVPEADGAMLIGTYHGIVRYRPTLGQPPRIEITELLAGELYPAPAEVQLARSEARLVTISFRGHCVGTRRMRYSYRLRGHDETWRETWDDSVRYGQLPVGEYRFEVRAISRDLLVSPQPAVLTLQVTQDPWQAQQAEYEAELGRMQQQLEQHRRTTRQNHTLVALAQGPLFTTGPLDEAVRQLVRQGTASLAAEWGECWLAEPGGWVCIGQWRATDESFGETGQRADGELARLLGGLAESRFLAVPNAAEGGAVGAADSPSRVLAPVRQGDEIIAVLVFAAHGARTWRLDEQQFVASLADLAGQAAQAAERQAAERRVGEQARLLDEVSDAVVAVDAAHCVISWNPAAAALYGWTAAEALGRPLGELLEVRPEEGGWAPIWAALETVGIWHGEAVHRTQAGEERIVDWSLAATTAGGGEPAGAVAVIRDITARKANEREQQRLAEQLQHAQKLESLGVMAGGIAHDFNNLLMGILGNAGLALVDLPAGSPTRQSLEQIELTAQRAAELTRQMLAYAGKGPLEIQPTNLSQLAAEMAHLLEVSISKKAVLRYDFAPDLPAVNADATQLRQVIMNLITNASESLGDAGGTITVRTERRLAGAEALKQNYLADDLPAGEYVVLTISDTGAGMDPATLDRIFEPFFTTKFTGRGLGLAAVLGIIRGHRGAIQVNSHRGEGTRFEILLPASHQPPPEPARRAAEHRYVGSGTILVIDDETVVLEIVRRGLEQVGFKVLVAADGQAGLATFEEHLEAIRLVVLDLTMPRMDGVETLAALRQRRPDVAVLLSSGYDEQEALERFGDNGLAGFLQKPYGLQTLIDKVRDIIGPEDDGDGDGDGAVG